MTIIDRATRYLERLDREIEVLNSAELKSIERIKQERLLLGGELYNSGRFSWWHRLWGKQPVPRRTVAQKVNDLGQSIYFMRSRVREYDRMFWFNPLKWFKNHHRINKERKLCVYFYSSHYLVASPESKPIAEDGEGRQAFASLLKKNSYGRGWASRFLVDDTQRQRFQLSKNIEVSKKLEKMRKENKEMKKTLQEERKEHQALREKHKKDLDSLEGRIEKRIEDFKKSVRADFKQEAIGVLKQRSGMLDREERNIQHAAKSVVRRDVGTAQADIWRERGRIYTAAVTLRVGHLFLPLPSTRGNSRLGSGLRDFPPRNNAPGG